MNTSWCWRAWGRHACTIVVHSQRWVVMHALVSWTHRGEYAVVLMGMRKSRIHYCRVVPEVSTSWCWRAWGRHACITIVYSRRWIRRGVDGLKVVTHVLVSWTHGGEYVVVLSGMVTSLYSLWWVRCGVVGHGVYSEESGNEGSWEKKVNIFLSKVIAYQDMKFWVWKAKIELNSGRRLSAGTLLICGACTLTYCLMSYHKVQTNVFSSRVYDHIGKRFREYQQVAIFSRHSFPNMVYFLCYANIKCWQIRN